jgi:hypothetical protein
MYRFKSRDLCLVLGLMAPTGTYAANFCVAVSGGFGNGGTSFVATSFTLPAANTCIPWSGFTKTATTVILISNGTACLSKSGKVITLSIFNTDPEFFGANASVSDQIQLCRNGVADCPISAQDIGYFTGSAAQQTCTANLLKLPDTHD